MADKLFQTKGVTTKVIINWFPEFLGCYPGFKSKYSCRLDQKLYLAQDLWIIQDWFMLYASVKAQYGILDENIVACKRVGHTSRGADDTSNFGANAAKELVALTPLCQ